MWYDHKHKHVGSGTDAISLLILLFFLLRRRSSKKSSFQIGWTWRLARLLFNDCSLVSAMHCRSYAWPLRGWNCYHLSRNARTRMKHNNLSMTACKVWRWAVVELPPLQKIPWFAHFARISWVVELEAGGGGSGPPDSPASAASAPAVRVHRLWSATRTANAATFHKQRVFLGRAEPWLNHGGVKWINGRRLTYTK